MKFPPRSCAFARMRSLPAGLCALAALIALASCRKSVGVAVVSSPLPAEKSSNAVVTYLIGTVEVLRGGVKEPAQLGMDLKLSDAVITGLDSLCEIRMGSLATIRLSQNTTATLDTIEIKPEKKAVLLGLEAGTLIQKVSKLSASDAFVIRTPSAVCGVRGTTFAITAEHKTGTSLVAVDEGRVTVLPASDSLHTLVDRARRNGAARNAYRTLLTVAPSVGPGQEYRSPPAGSADASYDKLIQELSHIEFPDDRTPVSITGIIPAGDVVAPEVAEARRVATIVAANLSMGAPRAPGLEGKSLLGEMRAIFNPKYLPVQDEPSPEASPEPRPSPLASPKASAGPQLDPLISQYHPGQGKAIRGALANYDNDLILALDEAGVLRAFRADQEPAWTTNTKLEPREDTSPVVFKAAVYLCDGTTLLGLEAKTGIELFRTALDEPLPPRMDILQTASGIVAPGRESVYLYDPLDGKLLRRDPVPGGLAVSPIAVTSLESGAARTNRLAVLSKTGTLEFRLLETGRPSSSFPNTGITYAKGRIMRELGGRLLVVDQSGSMSLFDPSLPEAERLVWQYQFSPPTADPSLSQTAIAYPTAKGLEIMEPATANPLGQIKEATGPFLLSQGMIYAGSSEKKLIVASANPAKVLGSVTLPAKLSATPLMVQGRLWLACVDGSSFWIDAKKLPGAK